MISCGKFKEHLYAFLDRETDGETALAMEQHRKDCPLCSLELEKEQKFHHILKTHLAAEKAPFALRESVVESLEKNKKQFHWQAVFVPRFAPVLALLTLVAALLLNQRINAGKAFPVFSEAVTNHIEYLKGEYPCEVHTGQMKEALRWFQGKTNFAVMAPHLDLSQASLQGGRIVHLKDKKAAYFVLEKNGYKISCFYTDLHHVPLPQASVKDGIKRLDNGLLVKTEKGYHAVFCYHKDDGTACIFVSDMPLEQLLSLIA